MDINQVLEKIKEIKPKHKTMIVGVDGRGGAGKSTLANKLKNNLENCQIIQMDDFYLSSEKRKNGADFNFDWKRLESEVLIPLESDGSTKYQRYDWNKDALAEWHNILNRGIIIIEGCYSIRKELAKYYDLTIWMEIDKEKAIERGIKRDIENEKPIDVEQKINRWKNDYQPLEDKYIKEHNPESYADVVINN